MQQKGSLRLRRRTWLLRLRQKDATGKTRFVDHRLGDREDLPTRAAARQAAARYRERLSPRQLHAGTPMQWTAWCDRYLERWLAMHARGTRTTQASIIETHLRHAFTGAVHEIDHGAVQDFIVDQRKSGAAASTIASRFAVLRRMLRQAAAEGLAVTPPSLTELVLPKDEEMHLAVREKAFAETECMRIFDAASAADRTAFMLGRYVGLRGSEICGLAWPLIDLETGAITVRQQALDGQVRPLKTKGSAAVLQAPAELLEQLRFYRSEWESRGAGSEFLFQDADGWPTTSEALRGRLHLLLDSLEIRKRGLHGFRHACALAMADAGVNPEAIRRAMRHSSLRVTAIYLSAAPEDIAAGLARGANRR